METKPNILALQENGISVILGGCRADPGREDVPIALVRIRQDPAVRTA